jgi:hypothetical protein
MTSIRKPSPYPFLANYRFGLLFLSLLLTLGGSEVLAELKVASVSNVLILLNLLLLLAVASSRWALRAGQLLLILSLISWGLSHLMGERVLFPVGQVSVIVFLIIGTLGCFRNAFSPGPVDRERLAAALSLYLLVGLIFALLFALVDKILPGSFHFTDSRAHDPSDKTFTELVYFSYVTLATLGYGDIVPLSGPAKGLAILEAIIGQIYLVVVVARLVSLYGQSEAR